MSATWPCRCSLPEPHPNLPAGYCQCGGYNVHLSPPARVFKPTPDEPVTTIHRRVTEEGHG